MAEMYRNRTKIRITTSCIEWRGLCPPTANRTRSQGLSFPIIIIIMNYQNSEDIQSKLVAVPVRGHVNRADEGFLQYFGHSHDMIRRFLQP